MKKDKILIEVISRLQRFLRDSQRCGSDEIYDIRTIINYIDGEIIK